MSSSTSRREFLAAACGALWPIAGLADAEPFAITEIDGVPVSGQGPPVYFVHPHGFIRGRVPVRFGGFVQLLRRRSDGAWIVARVAPAIRVGVGTPTFTLPYALDTPARAQTVMVAGVRQPLPPGSILDGPRWMHVAQLSDAIEVSCQTFERSRIRIVDVGGRRPIPGVALAVGRFEEIKIDLDGIPRGAIVQGLVFPNDGSRRWAMDHIEITHETTVTTNAYFGRSDMIASIKRYLDVHARFLITCVATAIPLPVHPDGIAPTEWMRLSRFVRATSPNVSAVRAILPDQIQVQITRLGLTNDGKHWLTAPVGRVEGTFSAGQSYRPRKVEIITLLVRRADAKLWSVAGETTLAQNRATWIMPSADLSADAPSAEPLIALAVVSYMPFDRTKLVSESDIVEHQLCLSDEQSYRISTRR